LFDIYESVETVQIKYILMMIKGKQSLSFIVKILYDIHRIPQMKSFNMISQSNGGGELVI